MILLVTSSINVIYGVNESCLTVDQGRSCLLSERFFDVDSNGLFIKRIPGKLRRRIPFRALISK